MFATPIFPSLSSFRGRAVLLLLAILSTHLVCESASAQILSIPYPEPSTNAALHYNNAMLSLTAIPLETREVLSKPIWESFGDSTKEEIASQVAEVVYEGRHALRAAIEGSRLQWCEFGIDYAGHGNGGVMPHAPLMLQLGRLVTLAGIHAQINGEQEEAAVLFFESMHMGHHLASQPTLIEALMGIEILENAYFSLAFWGARCDRPELVNDAFIRLELSSGHQVFAARTLAYEASIIHRQVDRLLDAYPDGPWAEMLLESMGQYAVGDTEEEMEAKALVEAGKRGIPLEVFKTKEAFRAYAEKFRSVHTSYFRYAATSMGLPCMAKAAKAQQIFDAYKPRFETLGDREFLDVREIANYFSAHEAELCMARVALAIAAERKEQAFPASLDAVKSRFAGTVPVSPYDGSQLEYAVLNNGEDFMVAVPEAKFGEIVMPRVEFSSVRRSAE